MRHATRLTFVFSLVLTVLAAGALPAGAGDASRTRNKGSSGGQASGGGGGGGRSAGAPTTATGIATWGHHRGHRGHPYRYYGHYGYYGYPYRFHFGYGYYWYPGWYGYWGAPWVVYGHAPYGSGAYRIGEGYDGLPAVIETDVRPKRATVLLDGVEIGQARDYNGRWDELLVEPGQHRIEFRYPGRMTLRMDIDTRAGARYVIDRRLIHGEGIDSRSVERPRDPPKKAAVPSAEPAEDDPANEQETVTPSRGVIDLGKGTLRRGLLRIDVEPADAAVYLDGVFLARADELSRLHGALPVARGEHTLEIVRPGYESERVDVVVEGREPVEVRLRLERRD